MKKASESNAGGPLDVASTSPCHTSCDNEAEIAGNLREGDRRCRRVSAVAFGSMMCLSSLLATLQSFVILASPPVHLQQFSATTWQHSTVPTEKRPSGDGSAQQSTGAVPEDAQDTSAGPAAKVSKIANRASPAHAVTPTAWRGFVKGFAWSCKATTC